MSFTFDYSDDYDKLDPGFYLFQLATVRDPKESANGYFKPPEGHDRTQPYREADKDGKQGKPVWPTKTDVIIEFLPVGNAIEDFGSDERRIYQYFPVIPNRSTGGFKPGQKFQALMLALGNEFAGGNDLEGLTIWATLRYEINPTTKKESSKIEGFTKEGPKRRSRSAARQEPPQASPDPIEEDEAPFSQVAAAADLALDDDELHPDEQTLIDQITAAHDADYLTFLADRAQRNGHLTGAVQMAVQRRATAFRAAQRHA